MSTYWNQLVLNVQNNTKGSLTWSGVQPLTNGTILSSQDVPVSAPDAPTDNAFVGRSSDRSLSGASGEARWLTADGTVLQVQYNSPNTGAGTANPSLGGSNPTLYKVSATDPVCDGSGCPIGSGFRTFTSTVTIEMAT